MQQQQRRRRQRQFFSTTTKTTKTTMIMTTLLMFFSLAVLVVGRKTSSHTVLPMSYQSLSDNGSTYASSIALNPSDNTILITGATYGSHQFKTSTTDTAMTIDEGNAMTETGCFLLKAKLLQGGEKKKQEEGEQENGIGIDVHVRQLLQTQPVVKQACSHAIYHDKNNEELVVAGNSLQNGVLENLNHKGVFESTTEYGMLMHFENPQAGDDKYNLMGGRLMQDAKVVYPMNLVSWPGENWLYVASMQSETDTMNDDEHDDVLHYYNENIPGIRDNTNKDDEFMHTYGSHYRMTIGKYELDSDVTGTDDTAPLKPTIYGAGFEQNFATEDDASVYVEGLMKISDDLLVVVGSTRGQGDAFGAGAGVDLKNPNTMDGFVTKLHAGTGELYSEQGSSTDSAYAQTASLRIESIDGEDDYVYGACHDVSDSQHIYVVGATQGTMMRDGDGGDDDEKSTNKMPDFQAFLIKINLDTLDQVWSIQLAVDQTAERPEDAKKPKTESSARGLSCEVTRNGDIVWVAGNVGMNSIMKNVLHNHISTSYGGTDVFVAKIRTKDGTVDFIQQIGSKDDDMVAHRNCLATDVHGNAILVGNTLGELYRTRTSYEQSKKLSDVFVTTISIENGDIASSISHDYAAAKAANANIDDYSSSKSGFFTFVLTVFFLCFVAGTLYVYFNQMKSREVVVTDRSKILGFLHDFDVEDIELRHSATGGWHCSYVNSLAEGRNVRVASSSRRRIQSVSSNVSSSSYSSSSTSSSSNTKRSTDARNASSFEHVPLTSSGGSGGDEPSGNGGGKLLQGSLFMDDDDDHGTSTTVTSSTSTAFSGARNAIFGGGKKGYSTGRFGGGGSGAGDRTGYDGLVDAYNQTYGNGSGGGSHRSKKDDKKKGVWNRDII